MQNPHDCCILVIDDDADNLCLMQYFLEAEGYKVATAQNGTVALAQAQASPPALILMDLMMPEMNGYEVTECLRQHAQLSSIPVVLMTAYSEAIPEQGLAVEIDILIRKPIDLGELLETVQAFC